MTLSDLASLGSFISGFAVLVSLIFLYFQLRQISEQVNQAERNQRALMQQGRANRVTDTTLRLAETEMSSVWCRARRGDKDLTLEEINQYMLMCRAGFLSGEDSFLQHLAGQLDSTAFKSFVAGARSYFTSPGLRAAWRLSAHQYGEEYARFMDGILKESTVRPEADLRANWLEAVRVEEASAATRFRSGVESDGQTGSAQAAESAIR